MNHETPTNRIDLQNKTSPLEGTIEYLWFENSLVGVNKTLFHSIEIRFAPFDSGLTWVEQPERPLFLFEWLELGLDDPGKLDGLDLTSAKYAESEASIYLGASHNWIDVRKFEISFVEDRVFSVNADLNIDFETEGVGENERLRFSTEIEYIGELIPG